MQLGLPHIETPPPQPAVAVETFPRKRKPESQSQVVLGILERRGPMTTHEVAAFCRLTAEEVGKRIPGLISDGAAHGLSGADGRPVTRLSPCGREVRVWSAQ